MPLSVTLVVSVRLTEDDYRVGEDTGPVEICVERIGQTTQPITVTLFTGELSPADAEGDKMTRYYLVTIVLTTCFIDTQMDRTSMLEYL